MTSEVFDSELDDQDDAFSDLDAHGVQERLRRELVGGADGYDPVAEKGETSPQQEPEPEPETAADEREARAPVWTAAQTADHVRMAEALLFAAAEPLDERSIAERLPAGADIPNVMALVRTQYESRGVNLTRIDGKWRFVTAADVAHVLEKERVEPRKLSRAALETLAIIAYHQPCTRADIEDVRGVAVSKGSLDQLMEIGWVRLRGRRKDVPGRPVLYGTTQAFQEHFGLESLSDLPGMADLKAAGLLDARLPPNFSIPTPRDEESDDDVAEAAQGDAEFSRDFLETPRAPEDAP